MDLGSSAFHRAKLELVLGQKNKKKKATSNKLQAASLTACPRYDRMKFYCNVKLNYLLQRLSSFNGFPLDKFVKPYTDPWRILQGPALTIKDI